MIIHALLAMTESPARPAAVPNSECIVLPHQCAHAKMAIMIRVYLLSCVGLAMFHAKLARVQHLRTASAATLQTIAPSTQPQANVTAAPAITLARPPRVRPVMPLARLAQVH